MTMQENLDLFGNDQELIDNSDLLEKQPPEPPHGGPIEVASSDFFSEYTRNAYLTYGIAVLKGRALPDLSDGQKPVQRRIIYSMHLLGLNPNSKHVKSARVVGDVLGKLHPHGDSSVYDAMVRQAQDFSLRYPLIDGQGNFGSRDGDSAAAMRYTEVRLTKYSELLLDEMGMGTVPMKKNYDGAFEEPVYLPARLPMLLLNGASGIAVGMATEIPSHNLTEIGNIASSIVSGEISTENEFFERFRGPDFPGGGLCISSREAMLDAYKSGKGSIALRCRSHIEELSKGQWQFVVTELPHGVSSAKILEQIEALSNPQPKSGKKDLDPEQKRIKTLFLSLIDCIRDESGKEHKVRIVIEPKSAKIDRSEFVSTMLAYTSLESTFSLNLVTIGLDSKPSQKGIYEIVSEWCGFRIGQVVKRIENRIRQIDSRLHILDGRMIAFLNIDRVIKVIREAEEPKLELMEEFSLSEIQAEDILEIRLRQLARLEGIKLESEIQTLLRELGSHKEILSTEKNIRNFVSREILEDTKKYGDERRTAIEEYERSTVSEAATLNEKVTVFLSKKGWIKQRVGHSIDTSTVSFKDGDGIKQYIETETQNPLCLITSDGRSYTISYTSVPSGKTDGVPLSSLIEISPKAKPVAIISGTPEEKFFICCDRGYGFISQIKFLLSKNKSGKAYFSVKEGEKLYSPMALNDFFCCVNSESLKALAFPLSELREADKGRGLQLLGLKPNERMIQPQFVSDYKVVNIELDTRAEIKTAPVEFELGSRAQRGRLIALNVKKFKVKTS